MANVMLPKYIPCSKQSPGSIIDWGNPLTKDLVYLGFGDPSGINFVNNRSSVDVNGQTPIPSPIGIGFNNNGSASYRTYPITPFSVPNSQVSIGAVFIPYSIYEEVICSVYQSSTSSRCQIQISGSGQWQVFTASGQLQASVLAVAGVPTNLSATFGMNETNGTKIFLNGSKILQGTLAATSGVYDSVTLGARRGLSGFGLYFNGVISLQAVWKRALTDEEHASFTANPWQLFHQRVQSPQNITTKENRRPIIRESNMLGTSKRKLSDVNLLEVLRKPMMNQPQSRLQIDWSNPITRGLTLLLSPNWGPGNHLSAGNYVVLDNKPMSSCKLGYGITNISTSGGLHTNRTSTLGEISRLEALFAGPHTLVGIADLRGDSGNTKGVFATNFANGAIQAFGFSQDSFENRMRVVVGGIITSITAITPSDMASHPVWVVAVGAPTNGGSIRVRVGNKITSATISGTPSVSSGAIAAAHQFFSEATGNGSSTTTMLGTYVAQLAWNRALSDAEILSISNNPWQIFRQSSNLPLLK